MKDVCNIGTINHQQIECFSLSVSFFSPDEGQGHFKQYFFNFSYIVAIIPRTKMENYYKSYHTCIRQWVISEIQPTVKIWRKQCEKSPSIIHPLLNTRYSLYINRHGTSIYYF